MIERGKLGRFGRSFGLALLLGAGLLAAVACGSGGDEDDDGDAAGGEQGLLNVAVASYELTAGQPNRFIAGVLAVNPDGTQEFVSYGSVDMRFSYLGDGKTATEPRSFAEVEASFLPVPGEERADPPSQPVAGPPSEGRGVYAVRDIAFDAAGFWQVDVTVDLDGESFYGASAFQVFAETEVPAVGDSALLSDSYTLTSDVPAAAIDSRAGSVDEVPDPELHEMSIADAVASGKPVVVVFSTPVFCVSQFCGPITDMIADLQQEYGDEAVFIHVEIWQDYTKRQATPTAIEWLYRRDNLQEPWVFLIGRDGTIAERWDNVVTPGEIASALEAAIGS